MDSRCTKFWDDGQELLKAAAADGARLPQTMGKMAKELRTMSRFLQKNQSQRFSSTAQQKLLDAIASYVTFSKQQATASDVAEATFQVLKDALAMPFNVVSTKMKSRLLKWYNELIGIVGGDADGELQVDGLDAAASSNRVEWSLLDVDADGYLTLLNDESGETCETFKVDKKSAQFRQIKKALQKGDTVAVVTVGDEIDDVQIINEA